MDKTDTGPRNTLRRDVLLLLIGGALTQAGSLVTAGCNDYLERNRGAELARREVYGNLRGVRHQVESLIGSKMSTRVRKEYTEAMVRILGEKHFQRAMLIEEARRLVQAEEALDVQIGQGLRDLHGYVARAETLFAPSAELRKRIDRVYAFTGIGIADFDKGQKDQLTAATIENWYRRAHEDARATLVREFRQPTNSLLEYLAAQLGPPPTAGI
jgi:hypothetical protein